MSEKTREGQDHNQPLSAASLANATAGDRPMVQKGTERRAHQKAITQGLRKFFDAVASEPVPDEFMDILKKMDDGKGTHQ
jgi:hypothetical protein